MEQMQVMRPEQELVAREAAPSGKPGAHVTQPVLILQPDGQVREFHEQFSGECHDTSHIRIVLSGCAVPGSLRKPMHVKPLPQAKFSYQPLL